MRKGGVVVAALVCLAQVIGVPASAVRQPEKDGLAGRQYRKAGLVHSNTPVAISGLPAASASAASADLVAMGLAGYPAHLDERTGRWSSILPAEPMLPGKGNSLTWQALGRSSGPSGGELRQLAWDQLASWIERNATPLRIDPAELGTPKVTVHGGGELVQIWVPRLVAGIPVRDSVITAVINNGNLVLFGTSKWADVNADALAELDAVRAGEVLARHVAPYAFLNDGLKATLAFVPLALSENAKDRPVGFGVEYRLAWVLHPRFDGPYAEWEGLVDAHDGELLAFRDRTNYASTRNVIGGVYPLANDNQNPSGFPQSDGVLQNYPLPFADMTVGATTYAGDSGGNLLSCVDGTVSTTLSGPYIDITDVCGATNESTAGNTLDLGGTVGTTPHDCAVPAGHSVGDTASARSAFYEINKIAEMGRGHLPENEWLQDPLPVQVNIALTCNATGGPGGLRFYRSGGGCTNTGEIAGVFDHEWGHGMDGADAAPGISNPGEGIADTYAALRLNTSCVGRNFLLGDPCGGYGDPCIDPPGPDLACDGVRDIDYERRQSGLPHTVTWANTFCGNGDEAPCGGGVHCEGAIYAEAIWDLWHRDLTASPFSMSIDTAREVAARLTFTGGQLAGNWYTCDATGCPSGFCGCNADGGYLNYLAGDDDDGNLNNGTPHMGAIFDAFNRHQLACATPTETTAGCSGSPTAAPVVSTVGHDRGATVSWGAVANADSYRVYRTEGVAGCNFGKTLIGETTGTSWVDTDGLQNGRQYNYMVMAMGDGDSCFGPASACSAVTPAAGANATFQLQPQLLILSGDNDGVLDNCEAGRVYFNVENIGNGSLTNLRIDSASSPSHPGIDASINFPATFSPSLASCGTALGYFDFVASGLNMNDEVEFEVEVTADEMSPRTLSGTVSLGSSETSYTNTPNLTYNFDSDLNGWTLIAGTFNRTLDAGADFSVRSSAFLGDQCDRIESPVLKINANSTLSLENNYDIEPFAGPPINSWYDRANVSLELLSGQHTVVEPSGGRLYNAGPGGNGTYSGCNDGETGWAGVNSTWGTATWSAGAFGGAVPAGSLGNVRVTYSTDPLGHGFGFWFDTVTLTNVGVSGPDTQPNACTSNVIFIDGFNTGNTSFWSSDVP